MALIIGTVILRRLASTATPPGNGGSLDKCRRRWDLVDSRTLKYKWLNAFDRAMCHLDKVGAADCTCTCLGGHVGVCFRVSGQVQV